MKKLRMIQSGWESYTGAFGGIEFQDGQSVEEVPPAVARYIAGIVQIETVETDPSIAPTNPSTTQLVLDSQCTQMPISDLPTMTEDGAVITSDGVIKHTQETLEKIADENGITGLRNIAAKLDVKGKSIAELIKGILNAQGAEELKPVPDQAPVTETPAETESGEQTEDAQKE